MPTKTNAGRCHGSRPPYATADRAGDAIGRRAFVIALGAIATWPLAARAEKGRKRALRVGSVTSGRPSLRYLTDAYLQRLRELGYVEGKNIVHIVVRVPDFSYETLVRAHREIVRRKVDVVFTGGTEAFLKAAVDASGKLPIVMVSPTFDPVVRGYAKSYRAPGGNVTGIYSTEIPLIEKRLQLMREALPHLKALTVFWDDLSADRWRETQKAAARFGFELYGVKFIKRPYDFERGFAAVPAKYRGGLFMVGSPHFALPKRGRLPDFALRHRLPTMFTVRNFPAAGGLMSYGANYAAMWARGVDYIDRIAKGADPATIPIERASKFDFVVNLKTAKALGLKLPRSILLRATEVIE
jgi:putative ABC transport system substrate-binding protein